MHGPVLLRAVHQVLRMIKAALFVRDQGEFLPDGIVEQREDTHRIPVDPVREGHRAAHFPDLHAVARCDLHAVLLSCLRPMSFSRHGSPPRPSACPALPGTYARSLCVRIYLSTCSLLLSLTVTAQYEGFHRWPPHSSSFSSGCLMNSRLARFPFMILIMSGI